MPPYLQVIINMLPLLLGFEIQTSERPQVLLAHRLIHRSSTPFTLTVVMRRVCPPICLSLDVAENHVLYGCREAGDLPRDVGLSASPRLAEMLQDGTCFVLLESLRHHVKDVVHHLNRKIINSLI